MLPGAVPVVGRGAAQRRVVLLAESSIWPAFLPLPPYCSKLECSQMLGAWGVSPGTAISEPGLGVELKRDTVQVAGCAQTLQKTQLPSLQGTLAKQLGAQRSEIILSLGLPCQVPALSFPLLAESIQSTDSQLKDYSRNSMPCPGKKSLASAAE